MSRMRRFGLCSTLTSIHRCCTTQMKEYSSVSLCNFCFSVSYEKNRHAESSLINVLVHSIRLLLEVRSERVFTYLPQRRRWSMRSSSPHANTSSPHWRCSCAACVCLHFGETFRRLISLWFVAFAHRTSQRMKKDFGDICRCEGKCCLNRCCLMEGIDCNRIVGLGTLIPCVFNAGKQRRTVLVKKGYFTVSLSIFL